jgi:hypothetical protein
MGTRWGINRTVAQIHCLFLSPTPLNAEKIGATLGVARSNVSNMCSAKTPSSRKAPDFLPVPLSFAKTESAFNLTEVSPGEGLVTE